MSQKVEAEQGIQIPLQWGEVNQVSTIYANQLYITHSGGEFYLVFGELTPIANIDKDNLPEYLEIKPVAKIAITPENMLSFSDVIQKNVTNFRRMIMNQENDEEDS